MKKLKKLGLAFAAAAFAIVSSCSDQNVRPDQSPAKLDDAISSSVISSFKALGFDVNGIKKFQGNSLQGKSNEVQYLLEDDIVISESQLQQMSGSDMHHVGAMGEQYRTNNLVSKPRTITIIGYTGANANGLDAAMRTGLQRAVANYNNLGLKIKFTLTFGTDWQSKNMVVYRVSGAGGGVSGFPSGGLPYKFVQIDDGTTQYGQNVVTHVITHEMGHCIGLRHTDYFNRSFSCGQGGNEGAGSDGAIHISGTPFTTSDPNFDRSSVMLSCFNGSESGRLSGYDVTGLNNLYK
jgi:Dual-action HEIGH metallo-peptidase